MLKMKADGHTELNANVVLDLRPQFTMLNTLELTCIHSCAADSCLYGSVVVVVVVVVV